MEKEFTGWVPTVGGRLSFSIIGQTTHPEPASFFNEAGQTKRFVFGYQHRNQSDASFFMGIGPLLNLIRGVSGNFTFAMLASSCDVANDIDEPLVGRLFIFYKHQEVTAELKRALFKVQGSFGLERKEDCLRIVFQDTLTPNLIALYRKYGIYMLDMSLARSGKAVFQYPQDRFSKKAFDYRRKAIQLGDIERHVASELFFFLKDVCHKHQHHSPRTDTIVDLYDTSLDKELWINETLRSLYKRVLDFKRSSATGTSYSALGLLAYVRSFKKSFCAQEKEGGYQFLSLNDDELESSINVCRSIKESATSGANEVNGFRLSIFVALFTVWAALFGLFGLASEGGKAKQIRELSLLEIDFVNALLANPLILLLPFWFFAILHASMRSVAKPTEFKRILFVIPKSIQLLILICLSLLLSGVGLWNIFKWVGF